jgi:predicted nucleotidyltransferase
VLDKTITFVIQKIFYHLQNICTERKAKESLSVGEEYSDNLKLTQKRNVPKIKRKNRPLRIVLPFENPSVVIRTEKCVIKPDRSSNTKNRQNSRIPPQQPNNNNNNNNNNFPVPKNQSRSRSHSSEHTRRNAVSIPTAVVASEAPRRVKSQDDVKESPAGPFHSQVNNNNTTKLRKQQPNPRGQSDTKNFKPNSYQSGYKCKSTMYEQMWQNKRKSQPIRSQDSANGMDSKKGAKWREKNQNNVGSSNDSLAEGSIDVDHTRVNEIQSPENVAPVVPKLELRNTNEVNGSYFPYKDECRRNGNESPIDRSQSGNCSPAVAGSLESSGTGSPSSGNCSPTERPTPSNISPTTSPSLRIETSSLNHYVRIDKKPSRGTYSDTSITSNGPPTKRLSAYAKIDGSSSTNTDIRKARSSVTKLDQNIFNNSRNVNPLRTLPGSVDRVNNNIFQNMYPNLSPRRSRSISPTLTEQTQFVSYPTAYDVPDVPNYIYPLRTYDAGFCEKLSDAVKIFCKNVDQLVKSRQPDYDRVYRNVDNIVRKIRSSATVEIYGSCATNLALPSSDLDLVVSLNHGDISEGTFPSIIQENLGVLRKLDEAFRKESWVTHVQFIETASVPVIKLQTTCNIPVDITMIQPLHSGKKTKALLIQFLQEYKELRYLILVLKQFLRQIGLHNPYTGGLGSYCLSLMVTSFLQIYIYRRKENAGKIPKNLGTVLLDVLQLYGKFDFERVVIKVTDEGGHIRLAEKTHFPLLVMDPCVSEQYQISTRNNVGTSAFMMSQVKKAFNTAVAYPNHFIRVLLAGTADDKQSHLKW